jgi:hypothetical protein
LIVSPVSASSERNSSSNVIALASGNSKRSVTRIARRNGGAAEVSAARTSAAVMPLGIAYATLRTIGWRDGGSVYTRGSGVAKSASASSSRYTGRWRLMSKRVTSDGCSSP